jgi:hypothetical protein
MKDAGIRRDAATYISALKASGSVGSLEIGEAIAEEIGSSQKKKDGVLGTALLDMYSKCGAPGKAREVFDQLPVQDDVSCDPASASPNCSYPIVHIQHSISSRNRAPSLHMPMCAWAIYTLYLPCKERHHMESKKAF